MDNVKHYSSFIKRIATAPTPIKVSLLKSSNPKIIKAIAEIVYNIIHKNIKVSAATLKKLRKFKKVLYKLVGSKTHTDRRQVLLRNPNCLSPLSVLFK
jgi:hypothetical protein